MTKERVYSAARCGNVVDCFVSQACQKSTEKSINCLVGSALNQLMVPDNARDIGPSARHLIKIENCHVSFAVCWHHRNMVRAMNIYIFRAFIFEMLIIKVGQWTFITIISLLTMRRRYDRPFV